MFLNETKLNNSIPDSHISHNKYTCYRRDSDYISATELDRHGGGIVIYIRKEYVQEYVSDSFECMHLNLTLKDTTYNFFSYYKSPSIHNLKFIEYLDNILAGINLNDPLFIIGDLNMDLLSSANLLKDFIADNNFKNFITEPTRVSSRFMKSLNSETSSSTLIDVLIHNNNLMTDTKVIDCPYSDHKFIVV